MKKKAIRKDFFTEIKKSRGRFISILFIVAMGVAFFSGIRSAQPDMLLTGDAYVDQYHLSDIKVISTLGISENDLASLEEVKGVKKAEGSHSLDVLSSGEQSQKVLHIMSLLPSLNQVELIEGRMPEKAGECIVDSDSGYNVGDMIWIDSGTKTPIRDTLTKGELLVVGKGNSPCYISLSRGSSMIGNGKISAFILVPEELFLSEIYSEAYIEVEGAREQISFTKEYEKNVDRVIANIEAITGDQGEARRLEIIGEGEEELKEAEKELQDGQEKAKKDLEKAQSEIENGEKELEKAKSQIKSGEASLKDAKKTLDSKEKELKEATEQYNKSKKEYDKNLDAYNKGVAAYNQGAKDYQSALNSYHSGEAAYQSNQKAYKQAESDYKTSETHYWQVYNQYNPLITNGRAELQNRRYNLSLGWENYNQLAASGDPAMQQQAEVLRQQLLQEEAACNQLESQIIGYETIVNNEAASLASKKAQLDSQKTALDSQRSQLDQMNAQLNATYDTLEKTKKELDSTQKKLSTAAEQLNTVYEQITSGSSQLKLGKDQLKTQKDKLKEAKSQIAQEEPRLNHAKKQYESGLKELDEEITKGQEEIDKARESLEDVGEAEWFLYDRGCFPELLSFGENADRMKAIGQVFPVLFFLVAALISLTSMTRMVEEQRTLIGTMKALGYDKKDIAMKYIGYAFCATLGGSVLGVLVGEKIIPYIIVYAYGIIYPHITNILVPYNLYYASIATIMALISTLAATWFACYKELQSQPAVLMRPPAPKSGKRVFLERFQGFWKLLNFTWKATLRNLFRYKKRFFMTVLGIGGCMGLLLFAFGLKDSIFEIAEIQFAEIQTYDGMTFMKGTAKEEEKEELFSFLEQEENVDDYIRMSMKQVTLFKDGKQIDVYQTVPEDEKHMEAFLHLHDRRSKEDYVLDETGVILSEKTAKILKASKGDIIKVEEEEKGAFRVKVVNICENYMDHYMYMSDEYYEEIYKEDFEPNCVYFKAKDHSKDALKKIGTRALKQDAVLNVSYLQDIEKQLDDMLKSLNLVTLVLIVSAGMLAFVVLYNLNTINITERRRELATLKVLGFYDYEVSAYVYRENIILTVFGMAAGVIIGILLHRFIIQTVEVESAMFGRIIHFSSYIYSVLFTFGFSFIVNWFMHYKLKKIDMIESLKSVE